jgi:hypothetical protein
MDLVKIMIEKFWDKLGENVANEWSLRMFSMAFIFCGIGIMTYGMKNGWGKLSIIFNDLGANPVMGGIIIVLLILAIAAANTIIGWASSKTLRLVEGYWIEGIRDWAAVKEINRRRRLKNELNLLIHKKERQQLDVTDERKFASLEYTLQYFFPVDEALILPTSIGNMLRSAEEYPLRVYGLEVSITFPHLWLVIPEHSRSQLTNARQNLDASVQMFLWCLLLLVWAYFQWWISLVVVLCVLIAWSRIKETAFTYAQLFRVMYDLYRFDLYRSLHWKLPKKSDVKDEVEQGKLLTMFIYRHQVNQAFVHSASKD